MPTLALSSVLTVSPSMEVMGIPSNFAAHNGGRHTWFNCLGAILGLGKNRLMVHLVEVGEKVTKLVN